MSYYQQIPAKDVPEIHLEMQMYLRRINVWLDKGLVLDDNEWAQYKQLGQRIWKEQRNGHHRPNFPNSSAQDQNTT